MALVLGGPERVRVVLSSSSTATPPSIAIEALVLGGPEVVRVVCFTAAAAASSELSADHTRITKGLKETGRPRGPAWLHVRPFGPASALAVTE